MLTFKLNQSLVIGSDMFGKRCSNIDFVKVVEKGEKLIVVFLADRIVLVVVALCAL